MGGLGTFLLLVAVVYLGMTTLGLVVVPLLAVPRKFLSKYEREKVHAATDRIDGGVRSKVAGALSHPQDVQGMISLPARCESGSSADDPPLVG